MPEKDGELEPPWVVPVSVLRIPTDEKATDVAASQIDDLLNDARQPFGTKFGLGDSETYKTPDETVSVTFTTRRGRECAVNITAWRDLQMRGKKNIPMHKHPFTVPRITVEDRGGNPVCRKLMWLIIFGDHRDVITLEDAYSAYRQRFDPEHFFRFDKTELLIDSYRTSVTEHEENRQESSGRLMHNFMQRQG